MFKNLSICKLGQWPESTAQLEVALWTGSLAPVIDDVIQALGGEV